MAVRRGPMLGCAVVLGLLAPSGSLVAAEWRGNASLGVTQFYSDNIDLAPSALAESEWVTGITPQIGVVGTGGRMRAQASYRPNLRYYWRDDEFELINQLDAGATMEVLENRGYLDLAASMSRQNELLSRPPGSGESNNNNNFADVTSLLVSPLLRGSASTIADYSVRYSYSWVSTTSSTVGDGPVSSLNALLTSGSYFPLLRWQLAYAQNWFTNPGLIPDSKTMSTLGNFNYSLFQRVGVVGGFRVQRNDIPVTTIDREFRSANLGLSWTPNPYLRADLRYNISNTGSFLSGGLAWHPTTRTRLLAGSTRESFGSSYLFDFSHRTRLTVWSATYTNTLSDTRQQLVPGLPFGGTAGAPGAIVPNTSPPAGQTGTGQTGAGQAAAGDGTAAGTGGTEPTTGGTQAGLPALPTGPAGTNFFSNRTFLERRFQVAGGYSGPRMSAILSLFNVSREAVDLAGFALPGSDFRISDNIRQTGTSLALSSRVTTRTSATATFGYTVNDYVGGGRQDEDITALLQLIHRTGPNSSGSLQVRRTQRQSDVPGNAYTENAAAASFTVQF